MPEPPAEARLFTGANKRLARQATTGKAGCKRQRAEPEPLMRRIAAFSLARPGLVIALAAGLAAILLLTAALRLTFDGDLIRILKSPSATFETFTELETRFHPFSRDEVLLLETDDFGRPERFEALEILLADFHFLPDIAAVLSVFTLAPTPFDPAAGLPEDWLRALHEADPAARMLMSADRAAMLVVLMPQTPGGVPPEALREAMALVADLGEGAINATPIGLAATYRALESALLQVQLALGPLATLLCLGMGAVLFRSWRGAMVIAVPALLAAGGFLGILALLGLPLDTITTLVPLLLLVVGVAQSMHLAFAITQGAASQGADQQASPHDICFTAVIEVGPACVLSTLTTALAFASFAFAGFDAMDRLALAGVMGLALQLAAVLTLTPALALLLGAADGALPPPPAWLALPARAGLSLLAARRLVIGAGLVALAVAVAGHLRVVPGHSLEEHLLRDGPIAEAEARIRDHLPGTGQVYLLVASAEPGALLTPANSARLLAALDTIAPDDPAHPRSVARLSEALARASAGGDADHPLLRRLISQDGQAFALPLAAPLAPDAAEAASQARQREMRLSEAGLAEDVRISGLSHLGAIEVPRMIAALRASLLSTILLIVLLVGIVTRSPRLALATLVPNAVPVLGIEAALWLCGQPLTMTAAVALTIAFGIAVDDTLHLLNRWRIERRRAPTAAIARTVAAVSRPIAASTALILAGLAATLTSALPSVATFGTIVMVAMLAALAATLLILPALLPADAGPPDPAGDNPGTPGPIAGPAATGTASRAAPGGRQVS